MSATADDRTDPELVIIARTDAAQVEAIERARRSVGMLFVEAPTSGADIERVAAALSEHLLLLNGPEGGRNPAVALERLRQLRLSSTRCTGYTPAHMVEDFSGIPSSPS